MAEYADGNFIHDTHWLDLLRGLRGNGIISGCNVDLTGVVPANRQVNLHLGTYFINRVKKTRAADQIIVIAIGDVTDPRWDLISINTAGSYSYLQGAASPMPSPPDLPADSLMAAMIYVPAGWTGPTSLSYIYDFGMASSWTADHVNAASPHSGHEIFANKEIANGYAGLDASGKITANRIITASITDANVTKAKIVNSAALSVIGNPANAAAAPSDIAAGTDGHVLRRSGVTLGFGTIGPAGITDRTQEISMGQPKMMGNVLWPDTISIEDVGNDLWYSGFGYNATYKSKYLIWAFQVPADFVGTMVLTLTFKAFGAGDSTFNVMVVRGLLLTRTATTLTVPGSSTSVHTVTLTGTPHNVIAGDWIHIYLQKAIGGSTGNIGLVTWPISYMADS